METMESVIEKVREFIQDNREEFSEVEGLDPRVRISDERAVGLLLAYVQKLRAKGSQDDKPVSASRDPDIKKRMGRTYGRTF